MSIEFGKPPVNINDRRIINGKDADVVQLYPMKHNFAWEAYNVGNANHWLPTEINMQKDVEQWRAKDVLTADERHALKMVLGFFTTADSIAANNIVLAAYKHITSPECRLYLLRQAYEEAVHTHAYQYIVESLGLDSAELFNMYRTVRSIYDKEAFILSFNEGIFNPNFKTGTLENDQKFVENIFIFSVIMEGIFFYSAFAVMFNFKRHNKLAGASEQIEYIMRDESQHLNFGIEMINTIKKEQPEIWTEAFQDKLIGHAKEAARLESAFAAQAFPNGIFGMNHDGFKQYAEYTTDRRLNSVGLKNLFNATNPFTWMSESIDISKEKNFFETRPTEYKSGGALEW